MDIYGLKINIKNSLLKIGWVEYKNLMTKLPLTASGLEDIYWLDKLNIVSKKELILVVVFLYFHGYIFCYL